MIHHQVRIDDLSEVERKRETIRPYFRPKGDDRVPSPVLTPSKLSGCRFWVSLARFVSFVKAGAARIRCLGRNMRVLQYRT